MAAGRFVRAAAQLLRILGPEQSAVAGGVAVNAHGFLRGTRDVDVIVSIPLQEAQKRLEAHDIRVRLFRGDALEGGFPRLKGVIGVGSGLRAQGVPFDVLPQLVPLEPERIVELELHNETLRVVDMDTLIRLKLKAGSVGDLQDIAILVNLHPAFGKRARELAASVPRLSAILEDLLTDPRTRSRAREIQRQDRLLRRFWKELAAGRRPRRSRRARS